MKIFIILGVVAIIFYFVLRDNLVKTIGSNNKTYYTRKNKADIAVEKLVKIDNFLLKLNKLLVEEHPEHILIQKKLKEPITLKELPDNSKHIAYTVNKTKLYICLRDNSGEFEDKYNRIYFVAMHELAHIITKSVGHTDEYWNNYKMVIKTAIKHKLYTYENYYDEPVKYCGKMINSSPYIQGGSLSTNNMVYLLLMLGLIIIVFTFLNNHKNDNKNIWQETIISKNIYSFISKLK